MKGWAHQPRYAERSSAGPLAQEPPTTRPLQVAPVVSSWQSCPLLRGVAVDVVQPWLDLKARANRRHGRMSRRAAGMQRASRTWKLAVSARELPGESADDDREDDLHGEVAVDADIEKTADGVAGDWANFVPEDFATADDTTATVMNIPSCRCREPWRQEALR